MYEFHKCNRFYIRKGTLSPNEINKIPMEYKHQFFIKNRPDLLKYVKRIKRKKVEVNEDVETKNCTLPVVQSVVPSVVVAKTNMPLVALLAVPSVVPSVVVAKTTCLPLEAINSTTFYNDSRSNVLGKLDAGPFIHKMYFSHPSSEEISLISTESLLLKTSTPLIETELRLRSSMVAALDPLIYYQKTVE
jgi:hypothetical protein